MVDILRDYIDFIVIIKTIMYLILLRIVYIYLKNKWFEEEKEMAMHLKRRENLLYWQNKFQFLFIVSTCVLIIYIFNPFIHKKTISIKDDKVKALIFVLAVNMLFSANWQTFINDLRNISWSNIRDIFIV
jgi:hypothetical protein